MGLQKTTPLRAIRAILNTLRGTLVLGSLGWLLGWALHSVELGFVFLAWIVAVGPLVLGFLFWLIAPVLWKLKAVQLECEPVLARKYQELILTHPGPQVYLWVSNTGWRPFLWWERLVSFKSEQEVFLSQEWLGLGPLQKAREFEALWMRLLQSSAFERRARSVQILVWSAFATPLSVLVFGFEALLDAIGFEDVPRASLWLQPMLKRLVRLAFGVQPTLLETKDDGSYRNVASSGAQAYARANHLHSVVFAPWMEASSGRSLLHPALQWMDPTS